MIGVRRFLSILCVFLITACGYQMVGKETHVPPGLSSVAIPTFRNGTYEPGIEIQFTQAFLTEFILDKRVKVVDRAQADSVLEGSIKDFSKSLEGIEARFVKVFAKNIGVCPDWHVSAGGKAWIFVDEITVK